MFCGEVKVLNRILKGHASYTVVFGWPKSFSIFFCTMLWKILNELFGQPNIIVD